MISERTARLYPRSQAFEKVVKRKVKLKIITASRQTIRVLGQSLSAECPFCEREVEMLTGAQAAGILEVDAQTFARLVESGGMHTIQTISGSIRVCKDSLFSK